MRPFFVVWTGQAFSLFGSMVVQFALVWWLALTTGSPVVLAIAAFVAIAPQVVLTPFAGALVDRWNRRRVMIAADGAIAAVTAVLVLLFATGLIDVWHVYVAAFLRAIGGGFHHPAMTASTTLMVPRQQLSRVGGLNQALNGGLGIVAPPVAALLLLALPMHLVLAVDIGTAAVAIGTLFVIPIPQPARAPEGKSILGDMREGFRYLWTWKAMLLILAIAMALNFLLVPAVTLVPVLVVNHFLGGAPEFAALQSSLGVGLLLGGLLLGAWGGFKRRMVTVNVGLAFMGVGSLVVGVVPSTGFYIALGATFLMGFSASLVNGSIMAVMQATVPPEMQGRVFALLGAGATAMTPIGLAIAGPVAEVFGTQIWFAVAGIALLAAGFGAFFVPSLMRFEQAEAQADAAARPPGP